MTEIRRVLVDYDMQKQMDNLRAYAAAEPERYEPLSRFEPAARRGAEVFADALLQVRPALTEAEARMAVDLYHLVAKHVHDPHGWDHVATVVDLLAWVARREGGGSS